MSSFYKRALICFVGILTAMLVCSARVVTVATDSGLFEAAARQSTKRVDVALSRGEIVDCNGEPLTGQAYKTITVVLPYDSAAIPLGEMLSGDKLSDGLNMLRQGQAVTVWGKSPKTVGGWYTFSVPVRYSGSLTHALGYINGEGHGVTGIEKYFDDVLYSDEKFSLSYTTDSRGRMLKGLDFTVTEPSSQGKVTLTVDGKIQSITEQAMTDVERGAAVVIEAETGKIKALCSVPDFDPEDVAKYLDDPSSPLINRAVCPYNVGSVFKPCLAVAAVESGLEDYRHICTGSVTVGDVTFKCHKSSGHGELGLKEALAESCNTYFYTLAEKLGAEKVYETAKIFRFGQPLDCNGGLQSASGSLPTLEKLSILPAELSNFSIGQGDLMLSPIAISGMYCAIANGGEYRLPYLVESVEGSDGKEIFQPSLPTVAFKKSTSDTLKEYLKNVLQNGTGGAAYSDGISAGGKTGTAQTGWKENGRSILNGWFCGFYEGKTADYVIVIVKEDVKSGSADCAPIFKNITENLAIKGF